MSKAGQCLFKNSLLWSFVLFVPHRGHLIPYKDHWIYKTSKYNHNFCNFISYLVAKLILITFFSNSLNHILRWGSPVAPTGSQAYHMKIPPKIYLFQPVLRPNASQFWCSVTDCWQRSFCYVFEQDNLLTYSASVLLPSSINWRWPAMDSIPSRRSDNTSQSSSCHIKSLYRWHMKIFHSINKLRIETKMKENNKGSLHHLKLRERDYVYYAGACMWVF